MPTSSTPNTLGVTPQLTNAIHNHAATIDTGTIALVGPDDALNTALAHHTAKRDVETTWNYRNPHQDITTAHLDIHLNYPQNPTWTIEEINTHIIHPAQLTPLYRSHIIIPTAHNMTPRAADRLLKLFEEPPNVTLFWLSTPTLTQLPTTLRARITTHHNITPPPPHTHYQHLTENGATPEQAKHLTNNSNQNLRLALTTLHNKLDTQLHTYAQLTPNIHTPPKHPVHTAHDIVAATYNLAHALTGARPRTQPTDPAQARKRLTTHGRAEARHLLTRALTYAAQTYPPNPHNITPWAHTLKTLNTCQTRLNLNNNPLHEIITLLTALNLQKAL